MTLKCQAFLNLMVQFLTSLDQNGKISLASLETEMEKLLECIVLFNPPGKSLLLSFGFNRGSGVIKCPSPVLLCIYFNENFIIFNTLNSFILEALLTASLLFYFIPSETDLQQRHMATCSLFAEMLTLMNGASVSTAEQLGTKLHSWVEKRARSPLVLPLLTAACRCLASVRHMARTTEACILSYFTDGNFLRTLRNIVSFTLTPFRC